MHSRVLLALAFFTGLAFGQFSPGTLSKAHSKLDGPTHCTSCHVGGGGGEHKLKCTGCHAEIRERLAANRGLHPALMGATRRDDQCATCHSEHNGEKFVPIRWDVSLEEFDHRKTGYALEGAHRGVKCDRCHNPERIPAAARKGILVKDLRHSYLGLGTACLTCHEDQHKGQLGETCERCHTVVRWKDVTKFDHSTAKFQLTGAHTRVECAKCHVARYTGIPFAQCADCHKDPHRGAFAAGCKSCHNDAAWKPARNTVAAFDHSKTNFPLVGKHAPVACDRCHRTADFKSPVAHLQCKGCHQDVHRGQFAARADGGDCAGCHTADGWKPSTYTTASHAKSLYPLAGKHAFVACEKCHLPAGAATMYKVRYTECLDCHHDSHRGQFADAAHQNRCDDCHTVDGFQPAKFTLARHKETRFALAGGHAAIACGDCHAADRFRFTDVRCTGCHVDPHRQQVRERGAAASAAAGTSCEVCHNVRTWRQVASFDHSKTRFALTGAHRGAACEECHRATALSLGGRKVVFQGAPAACVGCHEDVHAGQFAAMSASQGCEACHDNLKWKPGKFDHQRTSFSLEGAHERVPCRDCHNNKKEVNGRLVMYYKPTPKDCASCHGAKVKN